MIGTTENIKDANEEIREVLFSFNYVNFFFVI